MTKIINKIDFNNKQTINVGDWIIVYSTSDSPLHYGLVVSTSPMNSETTTTTTAEETITTSTTQETSTTSTIYQNPQQYAMNSKQNLDGIQYQDGDNPTPQSVGYTVVDIQNGQALTRQTLDLKSLMASFDKQYSNYVLLNSSDITAELLVSEMNVNSIKAFAGSTSNSDSTSGTTSSNGGDTTDRTTNTI